jgi:hypothetical protein
MEFMNDSEPEEADETDDDIDDFSSDVEEIN